MGAEPRHAEVLLESRPARVSEEERAAYGRSSPTAARMLANVEKGLERVRNH